MASRWGLIWKEFTITSPPLCEVIDFAHVLSWGFYLENSKVRLRMPPSELNSEQDSKYSQGCKEV